MYRSFRERQLQYRQTQLSCFAGETRTSKAGKRIMDDGYFLKVDGVNNLCISHEDPRVHEYRSASRKITGISALRNPHVYKVTCSFKCCSLCTIVK